MIYLIILLFDSMAVAGCILTTYAGINIKFNLSGCLYEDENMKVNYEECTVTYYELSSTWKGRVKGSIMAMCGIFIASCPTVFAEYIPNTHIGICGRIIFIPILTIALIFIIYALSSFFADIIFRLINKWASKYGITRKIKEGQDVY